MKECLSTHDSKLRVDLEQWAKGKEVVLDIIAETQDVSLKKIMAIDGMGLIPAAPYNVQRQVDDGVLIEIGQLKSIQEELYIIAADRKIENPVAVKILKSFVV